MTDLSREEVAPGIFRLPLPIPFEVGPVNCYLLRREEPVLVDAGPRTDEAWAALLEHLAALGFDPAALRHVVVSHAHVDHNGNVARVAALAPRARVHAHEDDARAIFEHEAHMADRAEEIRRVVRSFGYPEHTWDLAVAGYMSFGRFAESLSRERWAPVRGPEQALDAGPGAPLRAIHCPGHTEGLICLLLEEGEGLLLASDHILERITPNPTVYLPSYRGARSGLGDYVASLERVRDLRAARVLPGHGPSFAGLRARVDEILEHHEHRKAKVLEHLRAGGPQHVLGLVRRVWPRLPDEEMYLACREILGHLDLLIADKVVAESVDPAGVGLFRCL